MSFVSTIPSASSVEDSNRPHLIRRCESLWFNDGSIILQAQNTQFRVHRSVLSTHSEFFRDLFSDLQPGDESVIIEGCHVVDLPDKSKDWEDILNLLYRGLNMHRSLIDYPVPILISMLRIGDQYEFDTIKNAAYRRLESELPTKFLDWNNSQLSSAQAVVEREANHFTRGFEIDLINIATELDSLRRFLPVLYYILLRDVSLMDLFDGTTRSDGTIGRLSPETQRLLVLSRENIRAGIRHHALSCLFYCQGADECECTGDRVDILKVMTPLLTHDISLALQDPPDDATTGLCSGCTMVAKNEMLEGRKRLWNDLPSYFDLPRWDVLIQEV